MSWSGWTKTEVLAAVAEAYGCGWQADTTKAAMVAKVIGSAWVLARVFTSADGNPDDAANTSSAMNQLWFLCAMWKAGTVIAPDSQIVAMYHGLFRLLLEDIHKNRAVTDGKYPY